MFIILEDQKHSNIIKPYLIKLIAIAFILGSDIALLTRLLDSFNIA